MLAAGVHALRGSETLKNFDCAMEYDLSDRSELTLKQKVKQAHTPEAIESHWLLDSRWFNLPVSLTILANTAQIGLSVDLQGPPWDDVWKMSEHAFTALFTTEMLTKLAFLHGKYFADKWNIVDCTLVCLAVCDVWILSNVLTEESSMGSLTILRILRLCKILRMVRMFRVFRELIVLLDAITKSIRTMAWVLVLLCLILYVFAILCAELIGREESYPSYSSLPSDLANASAHFNNFQHFGTIARSMYTLFSLITLSEWSTVSRPISEKQPFVVPVLVLFTIVTAFGVMNVVIGVMVEHALDAANKFARAQDHQNKIEQMYKVQSIRNVMEEIDKDGDGCISKEELEQAIEDHKDLANLLLCVDLPHNCTIDEVFKLIDEDGDENISPDEFHAEMYRLVFCTDFQRMCLLQISLNRVKHMLLDVQSELKQLRVCQTVPNDGACEARGEEVGVNVIDEVRKLRSDMQEMNAQLLSKLDALSPPSLTGPKSVGDAVQPDIAPSSVPTEIAEGCRAACGEWHLLAEGRPVYILASPATVSSSLDWAPLGDAKHSVSTRVPQAVQPSRNPAGGAPLIGCGRPSGCSIFHVGCCETGTPVAATPVPRIPVCGDACPNAEENLSGRSVIAHS